MGKALTRPWREWNILQRAHKAGLPVPEPIAACACRSGLWYRAALIMVYLEDTEMLTQRLERENLASAAWHDLGLLVKRMHTEGIRHADLTSDNVLIDSQNRFYLVDFDQARIMNHIDDWQWRPLYRFQRSINKRNQRQTLHYSEDDWQALMDGYQS
jgi:3-deoxy-D-manno-octulosonic acid kinase